MSIFKKESFEEDYIEEEERLISGRRVRTKENPTSSFDKLGTTRGRKKEPPKPWTKKDRYLVLIILLLTLLISSILALSAREWKLPGLPRIKLPQITLFKGEPIILEGSKTKTIEAERQKANKITAEFRSTTSDLSGVYGLYVINLANGYSFGIAENEKFTAASLIKLPVIATMYAKVEDGSLNLENKYKLKNSDKVGGAGSLYGKPEGYQITYRNLVELMGKQSDNTAQKICRNLLGEEAIGEEITKIGMSSTSLTDNQTTPRDIGTFFEELWKGNVVSEKNRDEILGFLTDTIYEQWLKAGLPDNIRVAHKYGREVHVVNDAGIVYTDKMYVVVIMTKGIIEREADEVFPRLSRIVYGGMMQQ